MRHFDDIKVSHMSPLVADNVLNLLDSTFGKLKIVRGKQHEFLGMKIICQYDGYFHINMRPRL